MHHGLSGSADAWLAHGAAQCARWKRQALPVEFVATRLTTAPEHGDSVEAWARRERYRALRRMAIEKGADLVLLAHHRRDQAETFLLQALRAGGTAALSSMPTSAKRDDVTWARPWLAMPDTAIDAYMKTHRLRHVVDDTNADLRLARNRLRAEVWPALVGAFPHAETALAAAATLAQAAAAMAKEWAVVDLAAIASGHALEVAAWRSLPLARRANAMHAWLCDRHLDAGANVPRSLVERLERELDVGRTRRWPVDGGVLRSYRGALRFVAAARIAGEADDRAVTNEGATESTCIDLRAIGVHRVSPWRGAFVVDAVDVGGVSPAIAAALVLRRRMPKDNFQSGPERPARSLKLQFQSAAVPPWLRDGPVLTHAGRIVYVPGLGIDARASASSTGPSLRIAWRAD